MTTTGTISRASRSAAERHWPIGTARCRATTQNGHQCSRKARWTIIPNVGGWLGTFACQQHLAPLRRVFRRYGPVKVWKRPV